MAEKFPNVRKHRYTNKRRNLSRRIPNRPIPRQIIMKLLKDNDRETCKEQDTVTYDVQMIHNRLSVDFSTSTSQVRECGMIYLIS